MITRAIVLEIEGDGPQAIDEAAKQLEEILNREAQNFPFPKGVTYSGSAIVDPDSDEPDEEEQADDLGGGL